MSEQKIKLEGVVTNVLPQTKFKVKLPNDKEVTCTLCGKMRQFFIKVMPGDKVDVEVSSYDLTKGRIMFRYKK